MNGGRWGVLVGGPHGGLRVDVDPRSHNIVIFKGHWYVRTISCNDLGHSQSADYLHDPKGCGCAGVASELAKGWIDFGEGE